MFKLRLLTLALATCVFSCLDAPHDNIYDPENPDKAYLSAITYEFGTYPLEDAIVYLMQDDDIIESDTSDGCGVVEFQDLVPGIYRISAESPHFVPVEYYPESLWAGRYIINRYIPFVTLHFEDDTQGSSSPYGFDDIHGTWLVVNDDDQPDSHSIPNVYSGTDSSTGLFALSLCEPEADYFLFEARMKIDGSSGTDWQAGVVFRYQDESNHYGFTISPETAYCYQVLNGQNVYTGSMAVEVEVDTWHTIRVEHREIEKIVSMAFNDGVMLPLYDSILSGGRVGLFVSNSESTTPVTTSFDDITVDLTRMDTH
jgi:hypothetical protein